MKLQKKKRKGLYSTLSAPRGLPLQLAAYYLQGGKWKKVKRVKGNV